MIGGVFAILIGLTGGLFMLAGAKMRKTDHSRSLPGEAADPISHIALHAVARHKGKAVKGLDIFYTQGDAESELALKFFEVGRLQFPNLPFQKFEITSTISQKKFQDLKKELGIESSVLPLVIVGEKVLRGMRVISLQLKVFELN